MIEEARNRAVGILGEDLFWKVYDLCTKQMSKVTVETDHTDGSISPSDQAFLKVQIIWSVFIFRRVVLLLSYRLNVVFCCVRNSMKFCIKKDAERFNLHVRPRFA